MSEFDFQPVIDYLHERVKPRAQIIDRDPIALGEVLREFASNGWMALKRPLEYGGPHASDSDFRRYQEEVARTSGTFAFLQTQHQSAVSMLSKSTNEALKAEYLPNMANGEKFVGIGFSQLRRKGPPLVNATPVEGGFALSGHVPWVTGHSFYPEFLVGATMEDGSALFAIIPLKHQVGIEVSSPMELAAMGAAQTVTVDLKNLFVPATQVIFIREPGWIQNNDQINITLQGQFAVGCTLAALDIVKDAAAKKNLEFLQAAHESLSKELEQLREQLLKAQVEPSGQSTSERLRLRAWVIELMGRCAHTAVTASSGAANYLDHPAQRVFRESLVFTVSAQTTDIMEATITRLTGNATLGA
jgi:alkylation response protein AidB-like acyl-CoA dehydrogenase